MAAGALRRVIILGGSGFIGSALAARLAGEEGTRAEAWASGDCDLLDPAAPARRLADVDRETSLVFTAVVGRLQDNSMEAMRKNYEMARHCLAALAGRPLRSAVFLSTADVYGLPPRELPVTERTTPRPVDWYGWSKLLAESLFEGLERTCPTAVLRLPGVYGPGDRGRSVIGGLTRRMAAGQTISLTSRGRVRRDYLEIGDLCEMLVRTLRDPWSGLLNAVSGRTVTIAETAEAVAAAVTESLGAAPRIEASPTVGERDHDVVFDDAARVARFPDLRPVSVREGAVKYMKYFQSQAEAGGGAA